MALFAARREALCQAASLPAPEFEIIPDFVCLTIRFKELLKPHLSGEAGGQDDPINAPIKGLALEICRIIKANPGIKKAAIAQKVNRSEATVKRYAKQLSEAKLIEYKDSNKTGGYFVK